MKRFLFFLLSGLLLVACTSTPTPDLKATVEAAIAATMSAQPTETPTPTYTTTPTPTKTVTPTETPTPTPVPTFTLSGIIFLDYNGNGIRDEVEPPIPGVIIQVGDLVATSSEDGTYNFQGVTKGRKSVNVSAEDFSYISLSLDEFRSINKAVEIDVEGNVTLHIGLMQGFLTLPFYCETIYTQSLFVDLNKGSGIRDWSGGHFTRNGHLGIDYDMPIGQSIIAPAPGVVIEAEGGWPDNPKANKDKYPELGLWEDGNRLAIDHGLGKLTIYAHLKAVLVEVGSKVIRGQLIALSGNTGEKTEGPHLHFQFGGYGQSRVDPYRDVLDPFSKNYWTKDNDPQCLPQE